jgi:hypothetical protein
MSAVDLHCFGVAVDEGFELGGLAAGRFVVDELGGDA